MTQKQIEIEREFARQCMLEGYNALLQKETDPAKILEIQLAIAKIKG